MDYVKKYVIYTLISSKLNEIRARYAYFSINEMN